VRLQEPAELSHDAGLRLAECQFVVESIHKGMEALTGQDLRVRPAASRPLKTSKTMQPRSATAQSFQVPNHSRFGVPCTSQTISQTRLAMRFDFLSLLLPATESAEP
jgi:hypothetical protein